MISASKHNIWQRIAAATAGIVTPANALTIIGGVLVVIGLLQIIDNNYLSGASLLVIGRLLDLADGWAAESTGTKSPLGELMDATVDKLGTVATVIVFFIADVVSGWFLLALLIPHILIAIIATIAFIKKRQIHPSRLGKLSMAAAWLSLIGFAFAKAAGDSNLLNFIVYAILIASVTMGVGALLGYLRHKD